MRKINKSSLVYSILDEEFVKIVNSSSSLNDIGRKLGYSHNPGKKSKEQIKKRIEDLNLNKPVGTTANKTKPKPRIYKEKKEIFCSKCNTQLYYETKYGMCKSCFLEDRYQKKLKLIMENNLDSNGDNVPRYLRRYMFEKNNNQCEKCGWSVVNNFTGKIPLQVHHKDGNYKNNKEENLQLLCPNCHSLTETFGARNYGNGRERRKSKDKS